MTDLVTFPNVKGDLGKKESNAEEYYFKKIIRSEISILVPTKKRIWQGLAN